MTILREKGLRQDDPFNQTIVRSKIVFIKNSTFREVINQVSDLISKELNTVSDVIKKDFVKSNTLDSAFMIPEVSIHYAKISDIEHPVLYIYISNGGITKTITKKGISSSNAIRVFFFLVNAEDKPKQQLRMLSGIIDIAERDYFVKDIVLLKNDREIIEYLLHNKNYISFQLTKNNPTEEFINKKLMEVRLPNDILVVFVDRNNTSFAPKGNTILQENDILTIIGETQSIDFLYDRYILHE
ncbi:MAG: PTS sugar transporter subunit IIA [Bacteroidales bacterium]|nr:PTS sugar transporter subunit IIA [Bacteroidales bacterium]